MRTIADRRAPSALKPASGPPAAPAPITPAWHSGGRRPLSLGATARLTWNQSPPPGRTLKAKRAGGAELAAMGASARAAREGRQKR
jgi:hypothetical protein